MEQKLTIQLKIQEGDHDYVFIMPYGSPIGSAYNAAHKVLMELVSMAKNAAEKAKAAEEETITAELQ